jgi:hypothetical protein
LLLAAGENDAGALAGKGPLLQVDPAKMQE